jgi:hypothetical protein
MRREKKGGIFVKSKGRVDQWKGGKKIPPHCLV